MSPPGRAARRGWDAFATAAQFLTRLPLPGGMNRPDADPSLMRSALAFYPLVGGLIGAFTGAIVWSAGQVWPPWVALTLAMAAEAALTGALHEDAVADCCDGFGGGRSPDDVRRILKDSRLGTFGVLGLVFAVSLRAGCLIAIPATEVIAVSAAAGAFGRWAAPLMLSLAAPGERGAAGALGGRLTPREFMAPTVSLVPAFWLTDAGRLGIALAAAVVGLVAWTAYVKARLGGGPTGDCLGAGCYFTQLVPLMAAAA